jgi:hypothetical protein
MRILLTAFMVFFFTLVDASEGPIDTNVAGMAVSKDGFVHTFYQDGTRTVGNLQNLDAIASPVLYQTAFGKHPGEIIAVAMDTEDHVYAWYLDGTFSVGTPDDLDAVMPPQPFQAGYQMVDGLQIGYLPEQIRDIGITPDNVVVTYYQDGSMSRGQSQDLDSMTRATPITPLTDERTLAGLLGVGVLKSTGKVITWHSNATFAVGNTHNLEAHERGCIYSQHLTLHTVRTNLGIIQPTTMSLPSHRRIALTKTLAAVDEPVLAPGFKNVALAGDDSLNIFSKEGALLMAVSAKEMFQSFLSNATDPALDLNQHNGLYREGCQSYAFLDEPIDVPSSLCVVEVYDTRAAFDPVGRRFIYLANARNRLWSSYFTDKKGKYRHIDNPGDHCGVYITKQDNDRSKLVWINNELCRLPRRHLLIAVSRSEDPQDGFDIYAITENNFRDWPMLYVSEAHLIVGHQAVGDNQQASGYAAIVFDLDDMRKGRKRPRYFKLYREDLSGFSRLAFPRQQDVMSMEIAMADTHDGLSLSGSNVFGFTRFSTGYEKPNIFRARGAKLPSDHLGALSHGSYRWTNVSYRSPFGSALPKQKWASHLIYGRVPLKANLIEGIEVGRKIIAGGVSTYQPFAYEHVMDAIGNEAAFPVYCGRLAVAGNMGEVIGMTRVVFDRWNRPLYEAVFATRPDNPLAHWRIEVLKSGKDYDNTMYAADYLTPDPDYCVSQDNQSASICELCRQGAAAVDPARRSRVWIVQPYGMETDSMSQPTIKSAMGYVDLAK